MNEINELDKLCATPHNGAVQVSLMNGYATERMTIREAKKAVQALCVAIDAANNNPSKNNHLKVVSL
jgi:hypothetical protein